jgi:hypothetical protein
MIARFILGSSFHEGDLVLAYDQAHDVLGKGK